MHNDPDQAPKVAQDTSQTLNMWRDTLLIVTLSVFGLYVGSGFMIPLVLAILVFVLITAVSDRSRELWPFSFALPIWLANLTGAIWLANLTGAIVVLSGVFAVMYVLASQATSFALAIPNFETELDIAITRITALAGTAIAEALREMVVGADVTALTMTAFGGARLYVSFMMVERGTILRKVRMTSGEGHLGRNLPGVTREISISLQRYVGVKTFISVLTATISYVVFRYLGLEFAETWAVLTFALNFIPIIGSVVAVLFPAAASLVQFESFAPFVIILFGCGAVQFAIGSFLDPALLGRSLNLSTLMVILALTFWSAVWGIPGAFLSIPLTVCLLIVFSHIPNLRSLAILMSQDGSLVNKTPPTAPVKELIR